MDKNVQARVVWIDMYKAMLTILVIYGLFAHYLLCIALHQYYRNGE